MGSQILYLQYTYVKFSPLADWELTNDFFLLGTDSYKILIGNILVNWKGDNFS
jgi:hypothetical protein